VLLPLGSPVWKDLTACYDNVRAHDLLCGIVASGQLGEQWPELRDHLFHQGTIYDMTSAALPHLIRLAPSLSRDEQRELWVDIAFLAYSGAGSWRGHEPVPGMQQTLTDALGEAEVLALQAFLADDSELDAGVAGYYALWPASCWPVTRWAGRSRRISTPARAMCASSVRGAVRSTKWTVSPSRRSRR
jgi:hypothetical protein